MFTVLPNSSDSNHGLEKQRFYISYLCCWKRVIVIIVPPSLIQIVKLFLKLNFWGVKEEKKERGLYVKLRELTLLSRILIEQYSNVNGLNKKVNDIIYLFSNI